MPNHLIWAYVSFVGHVYLYQNLKTDKKEFPKKSFPSQGYYHANEANYVFTVNFFKIVMIKRGTHS